MFYANALRFAEAFHHKSRFISTAEDASLLEPLIEEPHTTSRKNSELLEKSYITHDPQLATLSPYQLFFSRSFMNAVTPHLVMSQTINPLSSRILRVNFDKPFSFEQSFLDPGRTLTHVRQNALVDRKFHVLLARFAETFQFTPRITFVGISKFLQKNHHDYELITDLVFKKILTAVRFHNLEHLDLTNTNIPSYSLQEYMKPFDDKPIEDDPNKVSKFPAFHSLSEWKRPQLLQSLNLTHTFYQPFDSLTFSRNFLKFHCPYLRRLEIKFQFPNEATELFSGCSKSLFNTLEELVLARALVEPDEFFFNLGKCRRLRKLVLSDVGSSDRGPVRGFNKKQDAIEECADAIGGMFASNSGDNDEQQQSQHAQSSSSENFSDKYPGKTSFSWVTHNCPLQVLVLKDLRCYGWFSVLEIRFQVLQDIADGLSSSLTVLSFPENTARLYDAVSPTARTQFNEIVDKTIFTEMAGLEVLQIQCQEITPESLKRIPIYLPNLRLLRLSMFKTLTPPDQAKKVLADLKKEVFYLAIDVTNGPGEEVSISSSSSDDDSTSTSNSSDVRALFESSSSDSSCGGDSSEVSFEYL